LNFLSSYARLLAGGEIINKRRIAAHKQLPQGGGWLCLGQPLGYLGILAPTLTNTALNALGLAGPHKSEHLGQGACPN